MIVYFIYANIPREVYDKTLKFLLSHQYDFRAKGNMMRGLYAITNKKKYVKEFFNIRSGREMYTLVEKEMSKEDWNTLSEDRFHDLLLKESRFISDGRDFIDMVVTFNEEVTTKEDGSAYISEFGPRQFVDIDYMIFSKALINALDVLGYTTYFDTSSSSFDPERKEAARYNLDFGQTSLGREMPGFTTADNEINILLYLYRAMFLGIEKKEEG